VSCLKKGLGPHVTTSTKLPPLDERGQMILTPEEGFGCLGKDIEEKSDHGILCQVCDVPFQVIISRWMV
jgi:hypothetical protein